MCVRACVHKGRGHQARHRIGDRTKGSVFVSRRFDITRVSLESVRVLLGTVCSASFAASLCGRDSHSADWTALSSGSGWYKL